MYSVFEKGFLKRPITAEQGVIQFYLRKITLHQQNFLVFFQFFQFVVVAKVFDMPKMKLLSAN